MEVFLSADADRADVFVRVQNQVPLDEAVVKYLANGGVTNLICFFRECLLLWQTGGK